MRSVATACVALVALAVGAQGVAAAAAPNVTIDHPLTGSSTDNQTPPFDGTTDDVLDPVTVRIYEGASAGGTEVQTLVVLAPVEISPVEATWATAPSSDMAPGQYTAVAEQTNAEPATGTSPAVTFTIDTTPPTVTLTTPTANAVLNVAKPTFSGAAGQADGDEPTVTLNIYAGPTTSASPIETIKTTPSGTNWTTNPTPALADGTYTVQAEQTDQAGNTGKSTTHTFKIDTTPPTVTLTSPTNNAVLNVAKPTFSGAAGQADGDEPTVTLNIYAGPTTSASPIETVKTTPNGANWTTNPTPALADGTYTAQAEQTDQAGNTGKSTTHTFKIDTTPPTVTLTSPTNNAVLNVAKPTFSGAAGQADGDEPTVTLNIYAGPTTSASPIETVKTTPNGANWTTNPTPALSDGVYTAQAEQTDQAGNTGTSPTVTFRIDTTPPTVTLTSPANGSSTSSEFESLSGAAGSAEGDLPEVTVKLFAGSSIAGQAPLKEVTVPVVTEHWSAAFGGLEPGVYTARAQQSDEVHNTGFTAAVTFTVSPHASPPTPPTPPTPDPPASASSPPVASFQWLPAAPHTGEAVSLVSTSTDATSPIAGFAWSVAGASAFHAGGPALTTSFSTPGSHTVLLRVTNAQGLSSVAAETIPVTSPPPTLMQPFPIVRIAGSENAAGAKIGLLTVLAPVGATVTVTCHGHGCPSKSERVVAVSGTRRSRAGVVLITFRRFQRSLRAGAILEIKISKPGQIGKYTRFAIRHGKLPTRVDMCLGSTGTTPIVCPSS